ncbi:LLM class flavin-dependent oxidoreductase [Nocardioides sp. SYSU D00038]|uniref:LLM class flavin-dependent oxidoreductase n=1 Tax=Nocardioides sp. SYSU D00038 TaxID=2812554 RepID=UPI0019689EEA|nr:LLM class flavin-dependent oxidoreductase [Nocardioides sp. SYSU D00038]
MATDFLWYVPNNVEPGHRGDTTTEGWGSLDYSTDLALRCERSGWSGALIGTGWGRPDTMTVATALAARTTTFRPLVAARPGYWNPAQFATAAATLDALSGGRLLVNIVTGQDNPAAYGDPQVDQPTRYARTAEFMQLLRRLWTEEDVTFTGEHYRVEGATVVPRPHEQDGRRRPTLYFGGASPAAERTAAAEADVQLFWGEPLAGIAERIERLRALEAEAEREAPLEFGLRITTLVRDTTEEAWRDAEAKVAEFAEHGKDWLSAWHTGAAVGQQRLLDLHERGDVLDTCLYTRPAAVGGGGAATTWLVGSPDDVAEALAAYHRLGISQFILSDTPYREEAERVGASLLPRVRELVGETVGV